MSIENLAKKGWSEFRETMEEIWNKYESSGENALDKLEEADEKFKELFLKSENFEIFLSSIRDYWQKNYHFVVNTYSQLIKSVKVITGDEASFFFRTILPEIDDCFWGAIYGKNECIALSEKFYNSILNRMKRQNVNKIIIISKKDNRLFTIIKRQQKTDDGQYDLLGLMEEDDIIKV